jgi:hypothetical protein
MSSQKRQNLSHQEVICEDKTKGNEKNCSCRLKPKNVIPLKEI